MPKQLLSRLYRSIPLIRELRAIRETVARMYTDIKGASAIQFLDFGLEQHPRYSDPKRLFLNYCQVCSQNGEDGMVREIFRRIGATNRVFVEIGVDSAENNTAFLLAQGWQGYWIDGNPGVLRSTEGRADLEGPCLKIHTAFVDRENVAGMLSALGVPTEFDILSLDVDQNTYYVWEGLAAFAPRVVVIEYNASMPPDLDWKVRYAPTRTWDGSVNFGASLKAFELLGAKLGYALVGCDFFGINAFFVRCDALGDFFRAPFTAENHFEPARYSKSFRRGHPAAIPDRP